MFRRRTNVRCLAWSLCSRDFLASVLADTYNDDDPQDDDPEDDDDDCVTANGQCHDDGDCCTGFSCQYDDDADAYGKRPLGV